MIGVRTSPFQVKMPILMGMYTSTLLQLLRFPISTPVAATPCFEPVLLTLPPYSNNTLRVFYTTQDLEHFLKDPELTVRRMLLYTALQARNGKGARIGLGEVISHGGGSLSRSRGHSRTHTTLIQPQQ